MTVMGLMTHPPASRRDYSSATTCKLTRAVPQRGYPIATNHAGASLWSLCVLSVHALLLSLHVVYACFENKFESFTPTALRFYSVILATLVQSKTLFRLPVCPTGHTHYQTISLSLSPPEMLVGSSWKNPPPSLPEGVAAAAEAPGRVDCCGPDGFPPPPPAAPALPSSPEVAVPKRERNMLSYFCARPPQHGRNGTLCTAAII